MDLQLILGRLRSPLFLIALTATLVLSLSYTVFTQQQQQLIDQRTSHYGNALAKLTAKQAANATLNNDLVSLQVSMENIADNPDVLSATIYDVENRLLVQAGDSPKLGGYSRHNSATYTAPITLHDSIAGYVAITIDTQSLLQQQESGWLIGFIAVALMLMGFSLMGGNPPQTTAATKSSDSDTGADPTPEAASQPPVNDDTKVTLLLHTLNLDTLRKQISGSFRSKLLSDLGKKIEGVNTLYSGKLEHASEHWLTLSYSGDDVADASFRATCASMLLFELINGSDKPLHLEVSAAIYPHHDKHLLSQFLEDSKLTGNCQNLLQTTRTGELFLHSDQLSDSLEQRLKTQDRDEDWKQVTELQAAYQDLLTKQARQLQHMLDHL
ncbi:MAG: hypothetical protein AseanaTS_26680 [Candidatus Pelagadaptatus aseana]|uniref:hypothetical protein n=1 Tax=Candidatus Pelagadaptatus aseana TaxID=3120508 RepID=UPI0039B1DB80